MSDIPITAMTTDLHVFPVDDLIDHDRGGPDCVCGPEPQLVRTNAGDRWIFVHNSLDGREKGEP